MLKTRVIPCLLLSHGRLVKTVKFKNPSYVGDPINAIKIYNEKEVDELILLDISATIERRKPDFEFLSSVASECFMPMAYGGGIRDLGDIKSIFRLGIEKVVINSYITENPLFIQEAARNFGSQSIVVSIDAKKNIFGRYEVFTHGGRRNTKICPIELAKQMQEMSAGEIFLTAIDMDGTMRGYDIELIRQVTKSVSLPVIACGGAGNINDFSKAVKEGGAQAVAAGSMFVFQGAHRAVLISYPQRNELEERL